MNKKSSGAHPVQDDESHTLELDEAALQAAKRDLDDGAVTPSYGPWRASIVKLLNE